MFSRLKYSRNALYINVLPFARYFRQRFAPFIRHRRRSQGYPYGFVTFLKFVLTYNLYDYLRAKEVRRYKWIHNIDNIMIFCKHKFISMWADNIPKTGCGIIQNLGSSWCQASLFCTVSKNNSHSSNPFQSLAWFTRLSPRRSLFLGTEPRLFCFAQ